MPLLVSAIIELAIYFDLTYDKSSATWIGFFGSYLGSIVGGVITLFVMDKTIKNGDANLKKSINENKILQQRNERVEFCNDLASIISNYCSETNKFIKFISLAKGAKIDLENHKKYLDKTKSELFEEELQFDNDIKNGDIPTYLIESTINDIADKKNLVKHFKQLYDTSNLEFKTNLEKANNIDISSLYFLLKIKLKNIKESNKLLELISEIYDSYIEYIDSSNLDSVKLRYKTVNELLSETTYFIDSYITKL